MTPTKSRPIPALSAVAAVLLAVAGCADPEAAGAPGGTSASAEPAANGVVYNLAPEQNRIRTEKDAVLAAQVPADIAEDGKLTVAVSPFATPLSVYATDDKTVIGNETDIAQLVADKLGLELDLQATSWENWPLKTQSGDFEAVFSNVGINADRVQLFDFAPYRAAFMAFEARRDSDLVVDGSADISGKKVAVGSGTNQEKILLAWNEELEDAGESPAELQYYGNDADTILALSSGRLDLNLSPYPSASYRENTRDDLKIVGRVNAGWPSETLVAATTLRGNGLVEPIAGAIDSVIEDGSYAKVLERWGLTDEAIPGSDVVNAANFGK
ncbi:polar amino acid transport system substrate-binding protein [Arthrobacter sp. PL16]|uniref:transporter substrate-binding domain-containing protein n=1 Tax=Arthrobacter sp. PL16 TaxID=3071720 RepID=UPI002E06A3F0|nr:polar amino acid transport system substrate-binding protein [Arthrobacter sp. PL16]